MSRYPQHDGRAPIHGAAGGVEGRHCIGFFMFDVPRLSIDIDLNYVGATDRATMTAERSKLDAAVEQVGPAQGRGEARAERARRGQVAPVLYVGARAAGHLRRRRQLHAPRPSAGPAQPNPLRSSHSPVLLSYSALLTPGR